jgi:multimeric flavodoxin WrbA
MKAILLDGSHAGDGTGARVREALGTQLLASGWEVTPFILREQKIGNCAGDFFCWTRSPGVCNVNDDNRTIAAAIATSDLIVFLTPVTFGGYSSALKKMVDHLIQNIAPFFAMVGGETHHRKRYPKYPDFLAVGWMAAPDDQAAAVFRHLVWRNSVNFYSRTCICDVVLTSRSDGELAASAAHWLDELRHGRSSPKADLPAAGPPSDRNTPIRRALLLVGSPRTRNSNSNALGSYLLEQFRARSIEGETLYPHTMLSSPGKTRVLLEAVEAADLVVLAFPLYVDSLPAPVIDMLERIAADRLHRVSRRLRLAAIVNCGFPEAHHTATAQAICEVFAQDAGLEWAGSLALGGGEIIGRVPLVERGGRTIRIRKALDLAAAALAAGNAIPRAAEDLMAKPAVPHWVYRLLADFSWPREARRHGAKGELGKQPYLGGTPPA